MLQYPQMDKHYDHTQEKNIYKLWENSGSFIPNSGKKSYSIIMPPPNANEDLHIGHARFVAIQDIIIRYFRLKGYSTLWLPGADHAGIETQFVFEKKLKEKGKSRFDYDRETLFQEIWNYTQEYRNNMENQLRGLGASCDWTRNKFTLDPDIVNVVNQTFKQLYDDGLVFRGERMVNYCTNCGTAYSELEVDHTEEEGTLYYLDYETVQIATTRPETIFADVAIAVNPKNTKLKNLIGKKATIPIIERVIPIISSSLVDIEYGTGALKVTPAHDPLDFEIGQKNSLPHISVIDQKGQMINTPKKYIGLSVNKAREEVVVDLENSKKLLKTEKITHTVGRCYRCKKVIEPSVSKQWFISVKPLTLKALKAINTGQVKFTAHKYEKIAKHWLKNLHDWNISRQIVWGIQIPAFRCNKCLEWTITSGEEPKECKCGSTSFTQDSDTFDTWFSSGQWPYATLMTTQKGDFNKYYPNSVMETAYDILPFWVIRMIMLGLYKTNKIPFKQVLIHGLVRDKFGTKISKSKGNVINPLVMVNNYGADALRMGLIWGAKIENDISLSEENITGQRNFANKLWNVSRYITMVNAKPETKSRAPIAKNNHDQQIIRQLKQTTKKISTLTEKYRLNEAAEVLYDFIWNRFANDYLEKTKDTREDSQKVLEFVLQQTLIISHPFMPFVTESIWQNTFGSKNNLLINESWPK